MGWAKRMLLGFDLANSFEIDDQKREITSLRDRMRAKSTADTRQDHILATLQEENEELKVLVSALSRLLVAKGVISAEELSNLVLAIDPDEETE